jgi:cellulose synthase (UDP-forming)
MMQNYLYGRYRWPWISELYEFIQSVYLLPALIAVVANPRKPTFKVTAKTESLDQSRISELGMPFFLIFGLLILGVVATVYRIVTEPYNAEITLAVGAWNMLNLVIAGCALGVVAERSSRRQSHRVRIQRPCEIVVAGRRAPGVLRNVSIGGAGLVLSQTWPVGVDQAGLCTIVFRPNADLGATELPCEIRQVGDGANGAQVGLRFIPSEPMHYRLISDLVFSDAEQWNAFQLSRRKNVGVIGGTLRFFGIALFQMGRGLTYLTGLQKLSMREVEPIIGAQTPQAR